MLMSRFEEGGQGIHERKQKVIEARLCETLPKTDRYDFMRLDRKIVLVPTP